MPSPLPWGDIDRSGLVHLANLSCKVIAVQRTYSPFRLLAFYLAPVTWRTPGCAISIWDDIHHVWDT